MLDRLSDRVAYLQDESLFMRDLLALTQQKLEASNPPMAGQNATLASELDLLGDVYADFAAAIEYPALTAHPCAGALMP